jgi:4,5:9,10-diseco-3-hydroxy-5,9,17-trioxoandrosta-1(10),2-diene-4-oate hydrolase
MADFVVDFMNTLGIDKASLVGNSMGGSVALGVAAHAPERVEKIVLADPVGFGRKVSPMMRMMTLPVFGSVLTKPGRQGVVRQMQLCLHDPSQASEDFIDRVTAIGTLPGSQHSFLSFLRDTTDIFGLKKSFVMDFSTRLKKVKTPTLVIWGRQDRLLPISEAKAALKNMKDIRLYVMDRAGHLPQIDNPEEFNTAVLDFLSTATRK